MAVNRRRVTPLGWTVRIVAVLVLIGAGLLAGSLVRGKPTPATVTAATVSGSATTVPRTSTTSPAAVPPVDTTDPSPSSTPPVGGDEQATVETGCLALQSISGVLFQAQVASSVAPLQAMDTAPGSAWAQLVAVETTVTAAPYRELVADAGSLTSAITAEEASGQESQTDTNASLTAVENDCGSFGYPTSGDGPVTSTGTPLIESDSQLAKSGCAQVSNLGVLITGVSNGAPITSLNGPALLAVEDIGVAPNAMSPDDSIAETAANTLSSAASEALSQPSNTSGVAAIQSALVTIQSDCTSLGLPTS